MTRLPASNSTAEPAGLGLLLRRAFIAWSILSTLVLGTAGILELLPYWLGGVSSFIVFPLYNLVCANAGQTNVASALLKLPQVEDFQRFLSDRGCTRADADVRDQQRRPSSDLGQFWGQDIVSRFFTYLATVMGQSFRRGQMDGADWLLYTFRTSVLFEALYYLLYGALTVCAIQLLNCGTHDFYEWLSH
jgi:hypothetical protein